MIIFTASASTVQYALVGRLNPLFAFLGGLAGFCGGLVGQIAISSYVTRKRKQSILVFLLAGITVTSAIAIISVQAATGGLKDTSFHPSQVCDK
jgi:uncharacterized membrane protein YfcA